MTEKVVRMTEKHTFATDHAPEDHGGAHDRLVVIDEASGELGRWKAVATSLGQILGLNLVVERSTVAAGDRERVGAVLHRAAALGGPTLVLPPSPAGERTELPVRELRRVLAPFDASDAVAAAARPFLARLQEAGIEVALLHVVTPETRPTMWNGSGHHAQAWRSELSRRHQVGDAQVEIAVGAPPATLINDRSSKADLVVLFWKCQVLTGRARLVRTVLASTDVPVLLLPVS